MKFEERLSRKLSISYTLQTCLGVLFLNFVEAVLPAAIGVPVDDARWIGYDGSWSPVQISVGSPVQAVDLFPSTAGPETLVIGLLGCDGTVECRNLRGGLFAANESKTFASAGDFDLGLDQQLDLDGPGYYGLDVVSLSDIASESSQVIAVVNSTEYWTGLLGLGVEKTTVGSTQAFSLLSSLQTHGKIPSQSYGYTAGASYRLKQVPASLTLGGYDADRFEPNNATFTLNSNQQPVLAINSIGLIGPGKSKVDLIDDSSDQALFTIDSTTPFLWLPETVAFNFEKALGLVYNETLNLYLYRNTSQYEKLLQAELQFEFQLSELPGNASLLTIIIPSEAFTTLNLTFGFPGLAEDDGAPPIPYFPVRKAANTTQYTIGRAFLQETYLTVDYGRNNFSISQVKFSINATGDTAIVDIPPVSTNNVDLQTGAPSTRNLPTGTVIGIAIGFAAIVAILTAVCTFFYLRRRRAQRPDDVKVSELAAREHDPGHNDTCNGSIGKGNIAETFSADIEEMPTPHNETVLAELPGSAVPVPQRRYSTRKYRLSAGHDSQRPLETATHHGSNQPADTIAGASITLQDRYMLSPGQGTSIHSDNSGFSPASADGDNSFGGPMEVVSPLCSPLFLKGRGMELPSRKDVGNETWRNGGEDAEVVIDKGAATYTLDDKVSFELVSPISARSQSWMRKTAWGKQLQENLEETEQEEVKDGRDMEVESWKGAEWGYNEAEGQQSDKGSRRFSWESE